MLTVVANVRPIMIRPSHCWLRGPGLVALVLLCQFVYCHASRGDQSWVFQKCLHRCIQLNCTKPETFLRNQPAHLQLLGWDCPEECKNTCMWITVEAFKNDGSPVPQFYGKWPFIRIFGIQEPASVIFSILNGLAHLVMVMKLRKIVPATAPMYKAHHIYAMVCINAWVWSTIFHTRDFPLTEKMDYFCATSLVLSSAYILCLRVVGTVRLWKPIACGAILLAFFIYHVLYLAFVRFDYGYNMKANITVGMLNSLGWMVWWHHHRRQLRYAWKAGVTVLIINMLVMLELGDFPPLLWTIDAHALWHASTAPVVLLWYSFVIDDCRYLGETSKVSKDTAVLKNAEQGLSNDIPPAKKER